MAKGLIEGQAICLGEGADLEKRRGTDASLGNINNAADGDLIGCIVDCLEVSDHVLNFHAGVEVHAPNDLIRNIVSDQFLFQETGLGVGTV